MGLFEQNHTNYRSEDSGSYQKTYMWKLKFNKEIRPVNFQNVKPDGSVETILGSGNTVQSLLPLAKVPMVKFHWDNSGSKAIKVLCNQNFDRNMNNCVACNDAKTYRSMYGKAEKKPVGATQTMLVIPVVSLDYMYDHQIHTGTDKQFEVIPLYWLEINVTKYIQDYQDNFERLELVDSQYPIQDYPMQVIERNRGEGDRTSKYFAPRNPVQLQYAHPFIDMYNSCKAANTWSVDYVSMFEYLVMLKFDRYVSPTTQLVEEYNGHYQTALDYFNSFSSQLPPDSRVIESEVISTFTAPPGAAF